MPATFQFNKPMNEVEDPILLPPDWYDVEIARDPKLEQNATLRHNLPPEAGDDEILQTIEEVDGAGFNLVVRVKTEHPEELYSGHQFTIWLSYPTEKDENRFTRGQKVADRKMQNIEDFVLAFGGEIQADGTFTLAEGMKGKVCIRQRKAYLSEDFENYVDAFAGFKPYNS